MTIELKVKNQDGSINTIGSLLELSNAIPEQVGLLEAPSAGTSELASRADHKHTIVLNNVPRITKYTYGVCRAGDGINCNDTGIIYTNSRLNGQGYCTCTTASNTANKTVSLGDFILQNGSRVSIVFTNKDTAGNITLNINNTGAKNVYKDPSTRITEVGFFNINTVYTLVYNGSNYVLDGVYQNSLLEDNSSTSVDITLIKNFDYIYSNELSSLSITFPNGSINNQDTINMIFKSGSSSTNLVFNGSNYISNTNTVNSNKIVSMNCKWYIDKWIVNISEV